MSFEEYLLSEIFKRIAIDANGPERRPRWKRRTTRSVIAVTSGF